MSTLPKTSKIYINSQITKDQTDQKPKLMSPSQKKEKIDYIKSRLTKLREESKIIQEEIIQLSDQKKNLESDLEQQIISKDPFIQLRKKYLQNPKKAQNQDVEEKEKSQQKEKQEYYYNNKSYSNLNEKSQLSELNRSFIASKGSIEEIVDDNILPHSQQQLGPQQQDQLQELQENEVEKKKEKSEEFNPKDAFLKGVITTQNINEGEEQEIEEKCSENPEIKIHLIKQNSKNSDSNEVENREKVASCKIQNIQMEIQIIDEQIKQKTAIQEQIAQEIFDQQEELLKYV